MQLLDWTLVGIYFLGLVWIVKWSAGKQQTTTDYFLAGRHAGWLVVGASLFASNVGSEHIVGLAVNDNIVVLLRAHVEARCPRPSFWHPPFKSALFAVPVVVDNNLLSRHCPAASPPAP